MSGCTILSHTVITTFVITTGFRKKLEALAKQKDCGKWERSIINHFFWCVASTPSGDGETMKMKWLSLDNHVHNVHSGHHELFPERSQGPLDEQGRNKKWFTRRKQLLLRYHLMLNTSVTSSPTHHPTKLLHFLDNIWKCYNHSTK